MPSAETFTQHAKHFYLKMFTEYIGYLEDFSSDHGYSLDSPFLGSSVVVKTYA